MKAKLLVMVSVLVVLLAPLAGPPLEAATGGFVLAQLRVPRVVLGAVVGAALGLCGAAWQSLLDNPLATPSTTGTVAGASLGALAVLVLVPESVRVGTPSVALGAFAGALAASLIAGGIASRRRARLEDVLLGGIAFTLAASAVSAGLQATADLATTARAVRWSLGSLSVVGYGDVLALAAVLVPTCAVVLGQGRALDVLTGGEELAHAQGVDVPRVRTIVLVAGSLAVGACVAVTGPIAFVGLVVPHLVRRVVGVQRGVLLPLSAVAGAAFLVSCDALTRTILPAQDLPVGVLTAAIGAPALVAVLVGRRVD